MNEVRVESVLAVTPELLARMFWHMDSAEQAKFFEALHSEIRTTCADESNKWRWMLGEFGDGQWYHLGNDLKANTKARGILMAMAAPLYLHTLRATGEQW